jgi:hypothetical protein
MSAYEAPHEPAAFKPCRQRVRDGLASLNKFREVHKLFESGNLIARFIDIRPELKIEGSDPVAAGAQ